MGSSAPPLYARIDQRLPVVEFFEGVGEGEPDFDGVGEGEPGFEEVGDSGAEDTIDCGSVHWLKTGSAAKTCMQPSTNAITVPRTHTSN
jgi:hypothetical protein